MALLDTITCTADIKKFSIDQLNCLCAEIRSRMISVVSETGGHLASSLGATDLTVALHYCLDTPRDVIVWDVGHQAYAHKILTGRNDRFECLRQFGGISGFPCKDESCFDPFTTGHSSNAVSLALGLASARDQLPAARKFKVAAVIGDGSISGGLCFEGLNNAGHLKKDILVILNTNEMSIAPNVGAVSTYLNKIISQPIYNRFKSSLESFMHSRMPKGSRIIAMVNKFEEGLKGLFVPGMLFEELGFRYFGPCNGHDLNALTTVLKNILQIPGPKLLHVVTKKGKGYVHAEQYPVKFHGIGPFDVNSGKAAGKSSSTKSYTDIFSETIVKLAQTNKKIVAITAAMPEGTGLDKFRDTYPARFFDVGIAEGHAVCFASGLAKGGMSPIVALYSTFLQRAYDQIIEDVALQDAPVIIGIDRAGIVGEDGATHQGIFDICFLRSIPKLIFMAPKDGQELSAMIECAFASGRPVAIRYPRAACPPALPQEPVTIGKAQVLQEGKDFVVIALGSMVVSAWEAARILAKEGLQGTVINARFIKPLDKETIKKFAFSCKHVFTVEEGIIDGGFGSAVQESLNIAIIKLGIPCEFVPHGNRNILLEKFNLHPQGIAAEIRRHVK